MPPPTRGASATVSASGSDWQTINSLYSELKQDGYFNGVVFPPAPEPTRAQIAEHLSNASGDPDSAQALAINSPSKVACCWNYARLFSTVAKSP
jgi:hypothetical protein